MKCVIFFYNELAASSEQVYAFMREDNDEKLPVAVNFTGDDVTVDLSEAGVGSTADAEVLLSSHDGIVETGARTEALMPCEAIIVRVR